MSLRNLLVSRADLEVVTEATDAKGHKTATWGKVVIGFRVRFNPLKGLERVRYDAAGRETTHRLYCESRIGPLITTAKSSTFNPLTFPDMIKGTQAAHRDRHRIVSTLAGITRYFQIESPFDTDEVQILCVIDLVERDSAWFNA